MTCIIGLVDEKKNIYMGGDSASTYTDMVRRVSTEKVFRWGNFIIGYTSSFRMGQILRHCIDFPVSVDYDEYFMVTGFIETVRKVFKEYGFSKIESNEETGGTFLVGVAGKGKIWQIECDFQVVQNNDGVYSIGSGSNFALGAMRALVGISPRDRIIQSLIVSSYYCPSVCPPYALITDSNEVKGRVKVEEES